MYILSFISLRIASNIVYNTIMFQEEKKKNEVYINSDWKINAKKFRLGLIICFIN